jgi:hypothetical protein
MGTGWYEAVNAPGYALSDITRPPRTLMDAIETTL